MTDDIKCPICGSKTILRTAKKGPDAGKQFFVCNQYPKCKGRANYKVTELQGVPEGTFRCEVCKFVYPEMCLGGSIINKNKGEDTLKHKVLCGICALWLGYETRFPQCFLNYEGLAFRYYPLHDEKREKINALHKELEIREDIFKKVDALRPRDFEGLHELNSQIQNVHELNRLRWSLLPEKLRDISDKLTRGERVDPSDISSYSHGRWVMST